MRVVKPSVQFITDFTEYQAFRHIEKCGRVCYKSEHRINEEEYSHIKFVQMLLRKKHLVPLEHFTFTIHVVCDRGVSHELVRHRHTSPTQESTRYCNYAKDAFGANVTFIKPHEIEVGSEAYNIWEQTCKDSEAMYFALLESGVTPQNARSALNNSVKTELCITMNLREALHIISLRAAPGAHPDMVAGFGKPFMELLLQRLPNLTEYCNDLIKH